MQTFWLRAHLVSMYLTVILTGVFWIYAFVVLTSPVARAPMVVIVVLAAGMVATCFSLLMFGVHRLAEITLSRPPRYAHLDSGLEVVFKTAPWALLVLAAYLFVQFLILSALALSQTGGAGVGPASFYQREASAAAALATVFGLLTIFTPVIACLSLATTLYWVGVATEKRRIDDPQIDDAKAAEKTGEIEGRV